MRAKVTLTVYVEVKTNAEHGTLGKFVDRLIKAVERDEAVGMGSIQAALGREWIEVDVEAVHG